MLIKYSSKQVEIYFSLKITSRLLLLNLELLLLFHLSTFNPLALQFYKLFLYDKQSILDFAHFYSLWFFDKD